MSIDPQPNPPTTTPPSPLGGSALDGSALGGSALGGAGVALVTMAAVTADPVPAGVGAIALLAGGALLTAWRRGTTSQSVVAEPNDTEADDTTSAVVPDLRTIAHEIRAPLAAATGHLDLAQSDDRDADTVADDLRRAARALARADTLVGVLLTPVGDGTDAWEEDVDLSLLLAESLSDFGPLAARRLLTIAVQQDTDTESDTDETTRFVVRGDARRLRQMLDNVVSNAVKYAPDESWVDVTLTRLQASDQVLLSVTNAGVTVESDELATIFESRTRGARADDVARGDGVGLSVVDDVVTAHRGQVEMVLDDQAQATTVRMTIPSRAYRQDEW